MTRKSASGRLLRFGMIFTNFTFVGMPVVEALYGQQGLFYFVVFLVPIRMIYYSSAKPMLSPPGIMHARPTVIERLKGYFSPPVAAVFVGLILYLTGLPLPGVLTNVIGSVGATCSPLGMILSGISLSKYNFKALLRPRYLRLPLVRILVMPAVLFGLTRLLPLDAALSNIVVIYAALPLPSLLAAFTIQYDPDSQFEIMISAIS
jgi:predicted permease